MWPVQLTAALVGISLLGYLSVFTICGAGALVAAGLLFLVPKLAFSNRIEGEPEPERATASPRADHE